MGVLYVGDPIDAAARLSSRVGERKARTRAQPVPDPAPESVDGRHSAPAILDAVDRAKPDDAVVVLEWTSADALWPRLTCERALSSSFPASGGLGWALPAAIGVQMADASRPVNSLIGDGAMQYTPAALWTAARYDVPVTFVICQNEEYGALQRFSRLMDVPDGGYLDIPGLDPVAVARGYGVEATTLPDLDALETFVRGAAASTGPRLAVVQQQSQR